MKKLTIEQVNQRFIEKNYTLLSTEYTGGKQKLQYICNCGNISMISITDLSRHKGRHKTIIEKLNFKRCVYLAEIDENDPYKIKIGSSKNIKNRSEGICLN